MEQIIPNVNMSPTIIEYTIVTNAPVKQIALKKKKETMLTKLEEHDTVLV
jgi:hypothetical protein